MCSAYFTNTPHSSNMHLKQKCIFKFGHHLPACFSPIKACRGLFCLSRAHSDFFFPPTFWPYGSWRNKGSIISSNRIWWQHAHHKRHGLVRRFSNSKCDCLNPSLDQKAICCLEEPQRLRFRKTSLAFYCVFIDAQPMTLLSTLLWLLTSTVRPPVRLLSWSRVSPSVCFHLPSDAYFV